MRLWLSLGLSQWLSALAVAVAIVLSAWGCKSVPALPTAQPPRDSDAARVDLAPSALELTAGSTAQPSTSQPPSPAALHAFRTVAWQAPAAEVELPPAPPPEPTEIPIGDPSLRERVQVAGDKDHLSLTARDAPLGAVLNMIAQQHGLNIVSGAELNQPINITLNKVPLTDALDAILAVNGFTWTTQRNVLLVTAMDGTRKAEPMIQGRVVQVFHLNYVSSLDVDKVVKGLLSPVGQSFIIETSPTDQRRTHEQIVVEDLPYYLQRINDYINAIDTPPRQVLVEAHVLQVDLKDNCVHGVNFEALLRVAGAGVTLQSQGFANPVATPGSFLRIDGSDLKSVIQALKTTTDAKTLASPKVAVLNGQEARIQVGGQIGYLTTTTTETTAVQTVNFINTGVILRVVPIITADQQILLDVKPQVSAGQINPTTQLPETDTTEVETKVMLADGEAIMIGGLIRETDTEVQNKIPWLGDVKYIGRLFQRRSIIRERSEVIITLLPRIISDIPGCREVEPAQVDRARTPLFTGPMLRVDRTAWEPLLPDATCPPRIPLPAETNYGAPSDYPPSE